MNNAFLRLKHYKLDQNDPQENHATECLAAALVFSAELRREFLRFLLGKQMPPLDLDDSSEIEVVTQELIEGGKWIDLILRLGTRLRVVIEVKVKSPENCDHHRQQLSAYRKWLDRQGGGFLFTLVRNCDFDFRYQDYGVQNRRTWKELHSYMTEFKCRVSETDRIIVSQLCEYLEKEAIVIKWKTADLLLYRDGLKAQRALRGAFDWLTEKAKTDLNLKAKPIYSDEVWSRLEIGGGRWDAVFGEGYNNKLFVWFRVAPIWGITEQEEGFAFDLHLWDKSHRNDWETTKRKLAKWIPELTKRGLLIRVADTWRSEDRFITTPDGIADTPAVVRTYRDSDVVLLAAKCARNEDDLLEQIFAHVKEYADIVSALIG